LPPSPSPAASRPVATAPRRRTPSSQPPRTRCAASPPGAASRSSRRAERLPALPECGVGRRGLAPRTDGRAVTALELLDARIIRRQAGGADRLRAAIEGSTLTAVARRGKFLWWRLADPDGADTGEALMGHLGMSGQLRLTTPEGTAVTPGVPPALSVPSEGPASDPLRHRRLSLHLDDGARVDLVDQRLFGGLWT